MKVKEKKKGKKKMFIALGVIVAVIVALVVVQQIAYNTVSTPDEIITYETTNPYIVDKTMVSAHRSGAGIMPEETMMAFKNCVENESFNTDVFEFDLHITKDGVLILLHDDTLDRTSDCEEVFGEEDVRPEDKTYEEIMQLNMGAKFEDENGNMPYADLKGDEVPDDLRIVTLDQILDYLNAEGDYHYIIEIKNGGDLGKQALDILYSTLEERNMLDRVVFGTFKGEISKYADEEYPQLMRSSSIVEVLGFYFKALVGSDNLDVNYVALQIPYKLAGFNLGTAKIINYAHENNLAVQYWTINDEAEIEYLVSIGADCIMSDYPDVAYQVVEQLEK